MNMILWAVLQLQKSHCKPTGLLRDGLHEPEGHRYTGVDTRITNFKQQRTNNKGNQNLVSPGEGFATIRAMKSITAVSGTYLA